MQPATWLAIAALTTLLQVAAPEVPERPHARCDWANEEPGSFLARVKSGTRRNAEYAEWVALAEDHTKNHGWRNDVVGPDVVAIDRAVGCPPAMLDAIAGIRDLPVGARSKALYIDFATALERNARLDASLQVLERAIAEYEASGDDGARYEVADIRETAAALCAKHGRWEEALRHWNGWFPHSRCGNCIPGERRRIAAFKARCLNALGSWQAALDFARISLDADGSEPLVECAIEASMALHPGQTANAAFEELLRGREALADQYRMAIRHVEVLRMAPAKRAPFLGELSFDSYYHRADGLQYLLDHPSMLDERLNAIAQGPVGRDQYGWLNVLAALGDDRVGTAIERALSQAADTEERVLVEAKSAFDFERERHR